MSKNFQRARLFCKFGDIKYEKDVMEESKEIELEFIKKFHTSAIVEHRLNNCSVNVLNYYLKTMKQDNKIRNQPDIRVDIIKWIEKVGGKTYADISITKAIADLSKVRILLPTDFKGVYYVNPLMYSKSNESIRKQLIIDLCRDRILVETDFKD